MNNFILKTLGIEDERVFIDHYIENKEENHLIVFISTEPRKEVCPECGSIHCVVHDYREVKIKHANFTSKSCTLVYKKRRFKCKDCNKVFNETNLITAGKNRISDLTVNNILKALKTKISFKDIGVLNGVTSQTVLNYMNKYICPERRTLPEIMCIDEFKNLSHGKGKYACLLLNYLTGEVVDVLPNRRLDYLQYYFNRIPYDERKNVKYVVSDMYEGYKHLALRIFPDATLVIDAFHYIRYISEAFNKVKIKIQKIFKPSSIEYKKLKKYWKLLSKDSNKLFNKFDYFTYYDYELSTYDVIQDIKNIHPDIKIAYLMKEEFFSSYRKIPFDKAESYLKVLINSMKNTNLPEFIEVADTFKHWLPYIINSFNKDGYGKRMSNGRIEGSNNTIKVIKRVSYGYSDFYNLRSRIMYIFNDDELPLPIPLSPEKIEEYKKQYIMPRKEYKKRPVSF